MPDKAVFDTRFFSEYFYSNDSNFLKKLSELILRTRSRFISSVTIYEVYRLALGREGRDVAQLRVDVMQRDFQVIDLDSELAVIAAEINHNMRHPMADSVIAATALNQNATIISDDPHFQEIRKIKVFWPKK